MVSQRWLLKRASILLLLLIAFWVQPLTEGERPLLLGSEKVWGAAILEERDGFLLLHLKGTPYQMGYQHGALLREEVRERIGSLYQGLGSLDLLLSLRQGRLFSIPRPYQEEMRGLAQGAGVSYSDILLLNTVTEWRARPPSPEAIHGLLTGLEPWWPPLGRPSLFRETALPLNPPQEDIPLSLGASFALFGRASKNGYLFQGFTLWPPLSPSATLLILYQPEGGDAFLALSQPGMVGVTAGFNEEKIAVAQLDAPSADFSLRGTPVSFLLREILEWSGDLSQATEIVASASRSGSYNLVLGDGKPASAGAMECSAHRYLLFGAPEDYLLRTNHFQAPALSSLQEKDEESEARYGRWQESLERYYGKMGLWRVVDLLGSGEEGEGVLGAVMAASDLEMWVVAVDAEGKRREWGVNLLKEMGP